MSLPKLPPMSADILHDCRLRLLDVLEDVSAVATLLREGVAVMENGERAVSSAQMCATYAADAATDAIEKLRQIALKCEEFAQ